MSEQKELNKQVRINKYRINLLHLNILSEIISLLDPCEEDKIEFSENNISFRNKKYDIQSSGSKNASSLSIVCSDGRKLTINIVAIHSNYTDDGYWDSKLDKKKIDIAISFSKFNSNPLIFTRTISYDEYLSLTTESFVSIIENLTWSYVESCKAILFKEEELDFLYDIISTQNRKPLDENKCKKKIIEFSRNILTETLKRL